VIYFILALVASVLGACCGLGGGVIVKPLLDAFTEFSPAQISTLSAFTVLTIAATSVVKFALQKTKFNVSLCVNVAAGAIVGGFVGTLALETTIANIVPSAVKLIQSVATALLLGAAASYMAFFKDKFSFHIKNKAVVFVAGLILGTVSSFLSIGGGPINVALIVLLFSADISEAAVSSLFVILLSQTTKILTGAVSAGYGGMDMSPLWILLPTAFIGALLGVWLHKKLKQKTVVRLYTVTVCLLIVLSVYNAVVAALT